MRQEQYGEMRPIPWDAGSCPHCFAGGLCRQGSLFYSRSPFAVPGCEVCCTAAALESEHVNVICSVCMGQGFIKIGDDPNLQAQMSTNVAPQTGAFSFLYHLGKILEAILRCGC